MKRENNYYGMNIKINSNNIFNNYNLNTDKALKIKIQEKEYEINDPNLIQTLISLIMTNGNLNNKLSNINISNKKNDFRDFCTLKKNLFSIPKELDKNTLELFIYLLSSNLDKNINLFGYIRKLINICINLNLYDIIKKEVEEYLLPQVSKNNCIELVLNFMDLIFQEKSKTYFIKLIKASISTIAYFLPEFINTRKDALFSLSKETLEEIIEIYIENKSKTKHNNNGNNKNIKSNNDIEEKNIKNVLNLLMYVRNVKNDMFYLLENERKNALKNFEGFINEDKDYKPKFIWKIKSCDISKEIYQEYRLTIKDINLLLIYYYEPKKDNFQLALQIMGINSDSKEFNELKNLLDLTTSSNKHKENKNIKLLSNDDDNLNNNYFKRNNFSDNEKFDKLKTKSNNDVNNINLIDIISILYSCEIPEIGFKSKINFNCVRQGCKSKFLIFKLENFSKLICFSDNDINNKTINFSIKFYFERNYLFSSIINHICKNLDFYNKFNSVNKIPKLALSLILKYDIDNSNNPNKDEFNKLQLIKNWLKSKKNYSTKNIIEIYKLIKWQNLSSNDLLDFFISNAKLLITIKELKNDIFFEIQRRFQSEYFNFFQNDKILISNLYTNTESNTESFRINNISKLDRANNNQNNNNSFTYDFLTKLLSHFSLMKANNNTNNNTNREKYNESNYESINPEINYATPMQEGRNIYQIINKRNSDNNYNNCMSKKKISKSIRLNDSPFYHECNQNLNQEKKNFKNINNKNKRNYQLSKNKSSRQNIAIKNLSIMPNNNTKKSKKNSNHSMISNYHNISVKNPDTEEKKNFPTSHKKYNLENYISNKSSKKNSSNFNMNKINFNNNNINHGSKFISLMANHNSSKSTKKIMNRKNQSKSVDKNLEDNRKKNNSLAEKNNIFLINHYLNGNKDKDKINNDLDKKDNNSNKINNANINCNNNNKKVININNSSRAKLIKSFNSLFSSRKRLKKNASENKLINPKAKKNSN